ncbi:metallophosphoesterase [Ammoniphilus sp. CFH 90114]|uniref:metallophosphoesterase family protein n=1 Tax=Ammoniphilus sp. CFH 90114 TaxID=2493665 RepID=UPI00100F026D|nr:metallophosphoesterase [Ammoniphilus sp. CFH 90114]RXT03726.1 metallophosphoesterase [Ammoniphilus sp. CFH 90114]
MSAFYTFRSPILSLWQTAIAEVGKSRSFRDPSDHRMNQFVQVAQAFAEGNPSPTIDNLGNKIQECAMLMGALAVAEMIGDKKRYQELKNRIQMSICDPGWMEILKVYSKVKKEKGRIPYIRYQQLDDFIIPIPSRLKIAFLSDWGTGSESAEWLLKQVMVHKPDLIIHLGDIYYSGTQSEIQDHFLKIMQKAAGNTPVYALAGNHEMYSGGKGYYGLLNQLNQPASYFCLRNEHWQFLAMDTALHDHNPYTLKSNVTFLDPGEEVWHLDKFQTAGQRKTILLSHHPLFSAKGIGRDRQGQRVAVNNHLQGTFNKVMDQVALWLWGHEHNLIVFDPYVSLRKGRCIGSGAIPKMANQKPYQPILNLNLQGQQHPPKMNLKKAKLSSNPDGFYYHAYAVMSVNGPEASIGYYEVDSLRKAQSRLVYRETVE